MLIHVNATATAAITFGFLFVVLHDMFLVMIIQLNDIAATVMTLISIEVPRIQFIATDTTIVTQITIWISHVSP